MNTIRFLYEFVFSEWWWTSLFFFVFFCGIYFGGIFIGNLSLKFLQKNDRILPIQNALKPNQISIEIQNSLRSIFVFSMQAIPIQMLIVSGFFEIRTDNAWNCLWEIPLLFLWNEIHFYCAHWLLHRKWFLKNIHHVHHWSKEPTLYATFSFHWVEAFLLGTVIYFPLIFHSFQLFSILSLPLMSIILNLIGHSNHEFPSDRNREHLTRFSFRHTMHHKWSSGNFGFMLPYLDQIFNTNLPKNKN